MLTVRQALLTLNALPGMGPVILRRLLEMFGGDPVALLGADPLLTSRVKGVGPVLADALARWQSLFDLAAEEERIQRAGVEILTLADAEYPASLRELPDPPIALYVRGRISEASARVGIIGTRDASAHGLALARRLARELAQRGIPIVSGLARGIDAAAHEGALEVEGPTLGVIGSGMDRVFPPEHLELYRRVAKAGAVLSEFPFGRPPDRQTFPIRNRVVAGLCRAVVVVESQGSGGAMITANFAADYGRLVFAVPGRIGDAAAEGPHRLIREGAILCRSAQDILDELGGVGRHPPVQGQLPLTVEPRSAPAVPEHLQAVDNRVRELRTCGLDGLAETCGLPVQDLVAQLFELELAGRVRRRMDGQWEAAQP